ncbi:hypothetical protein HYX01_04025 [Candidatus Woesearchaeota archaeon]|nr:hypothetical protein [Candidatus Woesearchaeota archaeon]
MGKRTSKIKKRAQVWFTDFIIGMLIFSFMLISYYTYTTNISKQDSLLLEELISDAESISSSLLLAGFPVDWSNETVMSIGITNNNYKINATKLSDFAALPYNRTKKLFGAIYDYTIFFTDESGASINVEGFCGIGSSKANISYDVNSAYYYDDEDDSFLKDFMKNNLNADIYSEESDNDFDDLMANIANYGFIVIEHPLLSSSVFEDNKQKIENFTSNKGILMLSGEIVSAQGKEMAGVKFYKKAGQSISDRNSTVIANDNFLSFAIGENIVFRQAYYVENQSDAKNFVDIVKFNDDNETAVSRWSYGNGSVFYFSDFDVSYFNGNFIDEVTNAIKKWGKFKCNPISLNNTKYKNLVKLERLLVYNSNPIKMVVYVWQ